MRRAGILPAYDHRCSIQSVITWTHHRSCAHRRGGAIAGLTAVFLASAIGLAYMFGLAPGMVSVESGPHMPDAPAREPVRNVTVPITVTAEDLHHSPNTLSMSQTGLITINLAIKDKVDHTI